MKLTPGKLAGLKAVSDARNVIAAAAMDQRGSLQKSLSKERGATANGHDLEVFKELVTDVLTQHASAILRMVCLQPSIATERASCWPTKRPDTTPQRLAACPICSTCGAFAAW
jgi:tagatose-1,6-bisphosphate aldolase